MQRIKDFLSGDAQTPPSINPNHSAKDDLRHAAKDLVHAKDDLKEQAKEKMHNAGRDVRNTADDLENRAAHATQNLRAGARDLRDDVRDGARDASNNVQRGARDLGYNVRDGARDLSNNVRDGARDVRDGARDLSNNMQRGVRDARDAAAEDLRDVRNTGRRASNEIDAKARAAGREFAADADDVARRTRAQAHNAKVEIERDVNYAASAVGNGLRDARDMVVGSAVVLEEKIEHGFDRLTAKVHSASRRARAEAQKAADEVHDEAQAIGNKVAQVGQQVDQRMSYITFANRSAPWFRDVGYSFDPTFYQAPLVGKRVNVTTPNLLGDSVRGAELTVSSVHTSVDGAANEQLSSNFRWAGNCFASKPIVRVQNGSDSWEFRRPQLVKLNGYATLPTQSSRPATVRVGASVIDRISGIEFGGSFKLTGSKWLAAYRTRLPYVALSGVVASDAAGERVSVEGGVSSTIFRDRLRDSEVNVGVQVKSAQFHPKQSSTPDALASVTAKIEYNEPHGPWNFDALVRARNVTEQGQQTIALSNAQVRGLYVFNQFQFPRTAVGVSVGVATGAAATASADEDVAPGFLPFNDPDFRVAHSSVLGGLRGKLDTPLVSASVQHVIDPINRVAVGVNSIGAVDASFRYQLRPDMAVRTSVATKLTAWDVTSIVQAKPQLGISLTIGAY